MIIVLYQKMIVIMSNRYLLILYAALIMIMAPILTRAQIPDEIISGLKAGDARMVASHFNDNIELIILDKENMCSQAQGEQILKDFFLRNKPSDFKVTHQGGEESMYAIGKMSTSNGNFRVYFLLKPKGKKPQIVQLRVDKD
jgi:hypothetical protein